MKKSNITGIVLAGGKSSRMGTDKSHLIFNDKTFIEHSIYALKEIATEIIIISNNEKHDDLGYKRIPDYIQDFGPVAGIYTGLANIKTKFAIILSCDIPLIQTKILKKLISIENDEHQVIQFEFKNKNTPLTALYKKSCVTIFKKAIKNKTRRLQTVVKECNPKNIILSEEEAVYIQNINTKEDFKTIK